MTDRAMSAIGRYTVAQAAQDDAMTICFDESLVLGLRALATLACRGPLDLARLAHLHGSHVGTVEAVVAELERGGLVRRLPGVGMVAVTPRGAALTGRSRWSLH